MTKSEILAKTKGIITKCIHSMEKILSNPEIKEEDKKEFSRLLNIANKDLEELNKNGELLGEAFLMSTFNSYYDNVYTKIKAYNNENEKAIVPYTAPVKVAKVVSEEDQTEEEKKANKKGHSWISYLLTALGAAGLALLIVLLLKSCGKDEQTKNPTQDDVKDPYGIEQTVDGDYTRGIEGFDMDDVNLESYEDLVDAAQTIKSALPENTNLTLEQIQYALMLGNLDKLAEDEQGKVFREAEEIYTATKTLGIMLDDLNVNADDLVKTAHPMLTSKELLASLVNVTDLKLTLDNFEAAKTNEGYDLYKVLEICGAGMDEEKDEELAFNYAATMNDIVAQVTRNFSMPENASENDWSYLYTTLGIYNANKARILELTSKKGLTTHYGTAIRNDGKYGDICVEELMAASNVDAPGRFKLYKDANGLEWPEGYVTEKNGKFYVYFVTTRDENGNAIKTETIEVTYSREVTPNMMLDPYGDYINAICDINNKGISR